MMVKIFCPQCSTPANPVHCVRKFGTAIGIVAGGISTISGIVQGAKTGSALGLAGIAIGAAAGSLLRVLFGISSGGLLGGQTGKLVDENLIGFYRCPKCHAIFKA